jgi:hypothetical protein
MSNHHIERILRLFLIILHRFQDYFFAILQFCRKYLRDQFEFLTKAISLSFCNFGEVN